jgi:hypothetical protein
MITDVSTRLVIEWSTPRGHLEETEVAMLAVRDHVTTAHLQVRSVRLLRQTAGPRPHVAYRWEEEYDSLSAVDEVDDAPACATVWAPVSTLSVPGTYRQSIWASPPLG